MMAKKVSLILLLFNSNAFGFQKPNEAEAISLFGKPLIPPALSQEAKKGLEDDYAKAIADYASDTTNADNIIWLGRRTAYLWKFHPAIDIFSRGIKLYPEDARFYRHRGHRFITIREFDQAIIDLEKAARLTEDKEDEIEPDGQPNKRNIPVSTLKFNIWYHLGLAYYLKGDFESALSAYLQCLQYSWTNDDRLCATSDWLYMTLRRLGRIEEATNILAPIHNKMEIIENFSYYRRLLMYKGDLPPDSLLVLHEASDVDIATQGYGVANWYLYNNQKEKAVELMKRIVQGNGWNAFGYIAAEADLKRMGIQNK